MYICESFPGKYLVCFNGLYIYYNFHSRASDFKYLNCSLTYNGTVYCLHLNFIAGWLTSNQDDENCSPRAKLVGGWFGESRCRPSTIQPFCCYYSKVVKITILRFSLETVWSSSLKRRRLEEVVVGAHPRSSSVTSRTVTSLGRKHHMTIFPWPKPRPRKAKLSRACTSLREIL